MRKGSDRGLRGSSWAQSPLSDCPSHFPLAESFPLWLLQVLTPRPESRASGGGVHPEQQEGTLVERSSALRTPEAVKHGVEE